ncbi:hypothetical protein [Falsirhodobacter xinxiangensis]|uniref:hypothetical protein n=1 Tax=Falsirhodobacter xinxiangensis TaxID=2530049 RepID=UPI0010A9D32F|nr:hypothetical protein [Rhodobacter xinxiangensis]
MADANHKKFGATHQGKGDGSGAMAIIEPEDVEDGAVLSNRDKSQDGKARGQDGKANMTQQRQDHAANRVPKDE